MGNPRVVVVGGYGAVGSEVCRMLASRGDVDVVVAGRNADKAQALAAKVGAAWCAMDVNDAASVERALSGARAVIHCFIDLVDPTLHVARTAAASGMLYLDIAAIPAAYNRQVLALNDQAAASGATLVTALGANPGIPALLALSNREAMDSVDDVDLSFTLGSRLDGLSMLSLRGVGDLMRTPPMQWFDGKWQPPRRSALTRQIGDPYHRAVYFAAAAVTADLEPVPAMLGAKRLAFWSAMEEALQGTAFFLGVKLGQTDTDARAARFLRLLRWLASSRAQVTSLVDMQATGMRAGQRVTRSVSLHASEEVITAVAPVVVCRQLLAVDKHRPGAFVAPSVVSATDFVSRLRDEDVHLVDVTTAG